VIGLVRKIGCWSCCLFLLAVLAGCGGGDSSNLAATRTEAEKAPKEGGTPQGETTVREATNEVPPARPPCPTPSQQLRVTVDSYIGAENAGFLMADKRGYFGDAGLHVWVGPPGNPELPGSYVASGQDDVGLVQQPQAVIGELGEPIVVIGSVIPEPTEAIIWLRGSGIENVADLKGKLIGTTGVPFQQGFLEQALKHEGLSADDVDVLPVGYEMVPTLLHGEVDAIFGGSANIEGKVLEAQGAEPVVTPVQELGIPAYEELVVIARSKCVARDPAMYRRLMAAVKRGTKAAVEDPRGAARLIKESLEGNPEGTPGETKAQLEATLPLLSSSNRIDLAEAADLVGWMREKGMIEEAPPAEQLFTNDYLAP
jgi:putative hydroxymethylpyrimidine transport system substrate-binding protein